MNPMLNKIRIAIKQKGQGIIEYAVLLAFIVGLAMFLQGGGLAGAVKETFDNVANFIALTTPEGRLKADKTRIKNLGLAIAANFIKSGATDTFDKDKNAVSMRGDYVSILVLPDGSMNIFCAQDKKWLTELDQNGNYYKDYAAALKNAGIDVSDVHMGETSSLGKTQYMTDSNLKLYSSEDDGGLKNGYAISFAKVGNEMKIRYYELNNNYKSEDLGTLAVPRSWLATGESNTKYSPDAESKYGKTAQTKDLDLTGID